MMQVIYNRDAHTLSAEGHCGGGPHGQDLVCAGASMLVDTLWCGLQGAGLLRSESKRGDGAAFIRAMKDPRAEAWMDFCAAGLRLLAESYPDCVAVTTVLG